MRTLSSVAFVALLLLPCLPAIPASPTPANLIAAEIRTDPPSPAPGEAFRVLWRETNEGGSTAGPYVSVLRLYGNRVILESESEGLAPGGERWVTGPELTFSGQVSVLVDVHVDHRSVVSLDGRTYLARSEVEESNETDNLRSQVVLEAPAGPVRDVLLRHEVALAGGHAESVVEVAIPGAYRDVEVRLGCPSAQMVVSLTDPSGNPSTYFCTVEAASPIRILDFAQRAGGLRAAFAAAGTGVVSIEVTGLPET